MNTKFNMMDLVFKQTIMLWG